MGGSKHFRVVTNVASRCSATVGGQDVRGESSATEWDAAIYTKKKGLRAPWGKIRASVFQEKYGEFSKSPGIYRKAKKDDADVDNRGGEGTKCY